MAAEATLGTGPEAEAAVPHQAVLDLLSDVRQCSKRLRQLQGAGDPPTTPAGPAAPGPSCPSEDTAATLRSADLLERARVFLRPGMCFSGTIVIPGSLAEVETNDYSLQVLTEEDGAIFALHSAYGDQQVVTLEVVLTAGEVHLRYFDAETFCDGVLDPQAGHLRGTVSQLMSGDEGYFHPSDKTIHVFDLKPLPRTTEDCQAVVELWHQRTRLVGLSQRLLVAQRFVQEKSAVLTAALLSDPVGGARLRALAEKDDPEAPIDDSMLCMAVEATAQDINWMALVTHAGLLAEHHCCGLRRLQARMQRMQFETEEDRAAALRGLPTRESVHAGVDAAFQAVHSLMSERPKSPTDPYDQESLHMVFYRACSRLWGAYQRFDTTLRNVERRLPRAVIHARCQRVTAWAEGDICSICQLTLAKEAEGLQLGCGHLFHAGCLFEWLHTQGSCPNCRLDIARCPADGDHLSPRMDPASDP
eukprot:GGOE01042723.1.p1 GENE.GGOE01042723.1~~GGOE01042723.1.p1  ORF type:complete len:509 (+),score=129.72 GGOE01042723.1:108-1529(+)